MLFLSRMNYVGWGSETNPAILSKCKVVIIKKRGIALCGIDNFK
jgi:hypothetical protein